MVHTRYSVAIVLADIPVIIHCHALFSFPIVQTRQPSTKKKRIIKRSFVFGIALAHVYATVTQQQQQVGEIESEYEERGKRVDHDKATLDKVKI